MLYPWRHVPVEIRTALLQCSSGRVHLLNTAVATLEATNTVVTTPDAPASAGSIAQRQTLLRLGCELLRASWEEQPFEQHTATHLLELDKAVPFLPEPLRVTARQMLNSTCSPDQETRLVLERLTRQNAVDELLQLTRKHMTEQPGNGFWQGLTLFLGMRHGRFAWLDQTLEHCVLPAPICQGIQADIAFLQEQWNEAAAGYASAYKALPLEIWREREAQALMRLGHNEAALHLLDALITCHPWHVQRLLQRDGLTHDLQSPGDMPEGAGVILLYTWNGGQKIHRTLEGLAASKLPAFTGTAQILLIDNGSTDGETLACMAAWEQTLAGRLRRITLPCNVGAPPARNWLLTQPESRAAKWLVFLDDDLIVPPDWLGYFGAIMRHAPQHDVYGCQIMRDDIPQLIQSADMHLLPRDRVAGPGGWLPTAPVHMQATYHGQNEPDFGQFAYARPCVHVSGCCHLFRREALDRFGGFDLRFAPTQVDDFEHDIRMVTQGSMPLYHGYLRVRHCHTTGLGTTNDLGKAMNAHANHLKLQGLYPPNQFEILRKRASDALLQDVLTRQRQKRDTLS